MSLIRIYEVWNKNIVINFYEAKLQMFIYGKFTCTGISK